VRRQDKTAPTISFGNVVAKGAWGALSSDTYYVNRCLDGHPDDFRHLVGRYQRVLVAHLVGRLGRLDAAEEAAQETLVRCYFGLLKLKKPS